MAGFNKLNAAEVRNAKPKKGRRATLFADGANLFLQATQSRDGKRVNRSWLFKYELHGNRHEIGLGPLHTISLAEARDRSRRLRQQILEGIDPLAAKNESIEARQRERQAKLAEQAKLKTFERCAEMYLNVHSDSWKNVKHAAQWATTLKTYAYPVIGDLAVADVETAHLVTLLQPLFKRVPETARRLRGRIEAVLGYATARGFRTGDNPARWRGHLQTLLGGGRKERNHQAAVPFADAPAFMAELRKRDGVSARALEFLVLTAGRTSEVIEAEWSEIDLKNRTWTVPAVRMKAAVEHSVVLSDAAIAILQALPHRGKYVFARLTHKPLSNMAMLEMVRRMRPGMTVHGFRATFKTWANERTAYPKHVAEAGTHQWRQSGKSIRAQ
jgi:integrase